MNAGGGWLQKRNRAIEVFKDKCEYFYFDGYEFIQDRTEDLKEKCLNKG